MKYFEMVESSIPKEHPTYKFASNTFFFAKKHKEIVDKFGRFPHRNKLVGRESTEEEEIAVASGLSF